MSLKLLEFAVFGSSDRNPATLHRDNGRYGASSRPDLGNFSGFCYNP